MQLSFPLRSFKVPRPRKPPGIWAIASLAAALAFPAPATSQTSWQMATEYPQSNISGIGLATFSKLVSAYSDGRITATIAYDNELKITSAEMPRAVQEQRIAGGDAFAGALAALDPMFGLASLPFVVQSVDVARSVNARARPLYEKALQSKGLKLLYLTIWPSTGIWSDSPLATADDLRGLKIRTYDASSTEVMRAAAASAAMRFRSWKNMPSTSTMTVSTRSLANARNAVSRSSGVRTSAATDLMSNV